MKNNKFNEIDLLSKANPLRNKFPNLIHYVVLLLIYFLVNYNLTSNHEELLLQKKKLMQQKKTKIKNQEKNFKRRYSDKEGVEYDPDLDQKKLNLIKNISYKSVFYTAAKIEPQGVLLAGWTNKRDNIYYLNLKLTKYLGKKTFIRYVFKRDWLKIPNEIRYIRNCIDYMKRKRFLRNSKFNGYNCIYLSLVLNSYGRALGYVPMNRYSSFISRAAGYFSDKKRLNKSRFDYLIRRSLSNRNSAKNILFIDEMPNLGFIISTYPALNYKQVSGDFFFLKAKKSKKRS